MKGAATILLLLILNSSFSQINITLSSRHQNKLSEIKTGHKRAKHFYRYFKKDSLRQLRHLNRRAKRSWDSLSRVARAQRDKIPEIQNNHLDILNAEILACRAILNNPKSPDSLREAAKKKARDLLVAKWRYLPNYAVLEEAFLNWPYSASWKDVANPLPGMDSIDAFFKTPEDFLEYAAKTSPHLSEIPGLNPGAAHTGLAELQEVQQHTREFPMANYDKVNAASADSLLDRKALLASVSREVGHLLSKYSSFSSATDLTDARRRTSLEGKTFFERVSLGGNVNVISTDPFCIDFSPQLGYRITSLLVVGLGMNYRISFGDSIQYSNWPVSTRNTAINGFASYEFLASWYGYAEAQFSRTSALESDSKWNGNYFVGLGKKFLVHPKLFMTLTLLYNLNPDTQNQIYPQRFQLRLGFQTSDLAFRKKRMNFDPNR